MGRVVRSDAAHVQLDRPVRHAFAGGGQGVAQEQGHVCRSELTIRGMLTFRAGDADRPRGHALVFFRDADAADQVWATYLVVAPIKMDLGKYIPAAFASQLAGQLSAGWTVGLSAAAGAREIRGRAGGARAAGRAAQRRPARRRDAAHGDPLYALQPVADIGVAVRRAMRQLLRRAAARRPGAQCCRPGRVRSADVDELLLQVMPDRDKVGGWRGWRARCATRSKAAIRAWPTRR